MSTPRDAVVRRTVVVPVTRERAFDFFVNRLIEWWPREFTFSDGAITDIAVEPWTGGRWYERDEHGVETAWGTVRHWNMPEQVKLSWKISPQRTPEPDESRASEVEITFVEDGTATTRIDLEHRCFNRHREGAEVMYAGMDSAEGWTKILDHFAQRVIDNSEHAF